MKNHAQQQAQAWRNMYIPKWEYLPNWDVLIQTHPLQSTPLHPPWGADKCPICVINYPEPKYIFFPPKNAPRRMQKCETVSGHLGNSDYEVSHVVDTCLRVPPTLPNSALAPPSHPAPSAGQPPYPLTQGTLLLILTSSGTHGSPINVTDFWLVGFCPYAFIKYVGSIAVLIHETGIYR